MYIYTYLWKKDLKSLFFADVRRIYQIRRSGMHPTDEVYIVWIVLAFSAHLVLN